MREIIIAVLLFATPAVAKGARATLNIRTLSKVHYCLGVYEMWIKETRAISEMFSTLQNRPLDQEGIRKQRLANESLMSLLTKVELFNSYATIYNARLPFSETSLMLAANTAGLKDAFSCGKLSKSQCLIMRDDINKPMQCLNRIPACSKIESCRKFDISF